MTEICRKGRKMLSFTESAITLSIFRYCNQYRCHLLTCTGKCFISVFCGLLHLVLDMVTSLEMPNVQIRQSGNHWNCNFGLLVKILVLFLDCLHLTKVNYAGNVTNYNNYGVDYARTYDYIWDRLTKWNGWSIYSTAYSINTFSHFAHLNIYCL